MTQLNKMKLSRVDVSAYSNNAIRKEDGRFYMAHEADAEINALIHDNARLYKSLNGEMRERLRLEAENERLRKDAEQFAVVLKAFMFSEVQSREELDAGKSLIQKYAASRGALPDTKGE